MKSNLLAVSVSLMVRRHLIRALTLVVALGLTSQVQAAFHLWSMTEVYSNSSGTLQFIEMFDNFGSQQFFDGQRIQVTNIGGTQTNTFIIPNPSGYSSTNSFQHALLFGTAQLHAAGGPTPDFIIPDGFLFTAGGTINIFDVPSIGGAYSALPTDGTLSRTWGDGNAVNSPRNFAGQTSPVVPEPAAITLAAIGGICGISIFLGCRRSLARMV